MACGGSIGIGANTVGALVIVIVVNDCQRFTKGIGAATGGAIVVIVVVIIFGFGGGMPAESLALVGDMLAESWVVLGGKLAILDL